MVEMILGRRTLFYGQTRASHGSRLSRDQIGSDQIKSYQIISVHQSIYQSLNPIRSIEPGNPVVLGIRLLVKAMKIYSGADSSFVRRHTANQPVSLQ